MDLEALLDRAWGIQTTQVSVVKEGLINSTWLVQTSDSAYILQQINTHVFQAPILLQQQLVGLSKTLDLPHLVALSYLPTVCGSNLFHSDNRYFRLMSAIEPSQTLSEVTIENTKLAAAALNAFHGSLSKIDTQNWKEPIVNFLNVGIRIQHFINAKETAFLPRMQSAKAAVHLLESNWIYLLDWQQFLEREPKVLIHADPKLSNFLFDTNGLQVRALIDWDTIQLGSPYYDYADMIRSFCSYGEAGFEVGTLFRADIFEALVEAFQVDEVKLFTAACGVILVQALRFLTDYLQNDSYYKVQDAFDNLRRAENQLRLTEELKDYWFTTRRRGR